jgi:hypothetical protein
MRRALATIFRLTGFALGLAAGGVLIALQWPDVMADLYSANSFRHFVRMFIGGILLGSLVCWPFWWVAGKILPEGCVDGDDPAAPQTPHRNEHRHAD